MYNNWFDKAFSGLKGSFIKLLLLIIIYLSFISLGLPDALLGSAWPAMYKSLSVPIHYAGILSMIIAGGTVVSSLLSVKIIRTFGTGPVTVSSVFLTAGALVGFSFSHNFIYLCILAVPLGLGAGSVDTALNNYVALHFKAKHMNWLHCFWGVGASIGPLIMSASLSVGASWPRGYRAVGIIQFCLVVLLLVSLPLWKKHQPDSIKIHGGVNKKLPFKALFRISGLKPMMVVFFCYCALEAIAGLWGASYLVMVRNISPEQAARWITLFYLGITAGRFFSGFLSIKFNNRQLVRLGHILIVSGIVVLLLPFDITMLAGFLLIGLGCAPIYPSLLHETPRNFGREYSQPIMGMQMASAYIGTTLMPPLFGQLAAFLDFSIFPVCIGGILAIKIFLTEWLNFKRPPEKGLPEVERE